jgi:hypothetical protein
MQYYRLITDASLRIGAAPVEVSRQPLHKAFFTMWEGYSAAVTALADKMAAEAPGPGRGRCVCVCVCDSGRCS